MNYIHIYGIYIYIYELQPIYNCFVDTIYPNNRNKSYYMMLHNIINPLNTASLAMYQGCSNQCDATQR